MKKTLVATALAASFAVSAAYAQDGTLSCDDLSWSAQVLAANPDVGEACQGVYERNGTLYAKAQVEVQRARGNKITFRPLHTDGSKGSVRSLTVPFSWRASIGGESYRASELLPGQVLDVYLPEDRFALAVDDGDFGGDEVLILIEEEVVMVSMPKTASPTFTLLAGGLAFLGLGALLTARRKVRA